MNVGRITEAVNNFVRMFQDLLSAVVDLVLLSIQMDCPVMVHTHTLMINVKRFKNYAMKEAIREELVADVNYEPNI